MIRWLLALGVPSILATAAIAFWQHHKAGKTQRILEETLAAMPQQVANTVSKVVTLHLTAASDKSMLPTTTLIGLSDPNFPSFMQMVDINNDGKNELIVQFPAGAHGNGMKVFGWKDREYQELASLGAGTPVPFEFTDFDKDGLTEVEVTETDWSVDLPYSLAPRLKIYYRFVEDKFVEVSRKKDYTEAELEALQHEQKKSRLT